MKTTTKAIAAIMLMFATVLATGCTEKENNQEDDNDLVSGDWVDLGLPSGLLWATRNVGASSPTDFGNYYAWGETKFKSVYNWSTYRYCEYHGLYDHPLTKYIDTDTLTTLQPDDDAATVNYGGRTPTRAEWEELQENTTHQWVTINEVSGMNIIGPNGNSLFLPAAGERYDSLIYLVGNFGRYWSSSLFSGIDVYLCNMGPNTMELSYNWGVHGYRHYGHSVRAVRDAQ